jgi:DNA-binding NarL/FixJ family response regulator
MIKVLIVDDYEDWRRAVRQLLQERPELRIICEVSDGVEAVQKAGELKPDLIVLDIGLPKLNGIEAARQIRQLSPSSKIIVLSLDNSVEVVDVALGTGAQAYVYKTDVGSDLLSAIEAVLRGKQFVSRSLKGYKFTDTPREEVTHRHEVLFYSNDMIFLDGFTRVIAAALKTDNPVILIATKSHQDSLIQRLRAECADVDGAIQQGTYISLDASDTLNTIMVNGLPDPILFFDGITGLIEATSKAAKAEHSRVAFCGERVGLLWAEGRTDAAIRLEQLCNDLTRTHDVDILCAYPLSGFRGEVDGRDFRSICAEHSAVHSR